MPVATNGKEREISLKNKAQGILQVLFQLHKAQLQWETLPTANFKKQLFRAWKVVYWFSPPDTLESRQWACQVLFQLPRAQLQWETLPTGKLKKKNQGLKSCFLIFPSRHPWEQAVSFGPTPPSHVWTRLVPQKPRELPILMERGEVINSEFRFSEARYTI